MLLSAVERPRSSSWVKAFIQRRSFVRVVLIAISFATVSVALLSLPLAPLDYWYLYFSPVLLAALAFGLRGAIFASAIATIHVLALQEWARLFHARNDGLGEELLQQPHPIEQLIESLAQITGLPAEALTRPFWLLTGSTTDLTLQAAKAGIGLLLVIAAAVVMGWLVDQNRRKEEMLFRLASMDALTGLWNRWAFQEQLIQETARAERTGKCFAVVMIDIDHFKRLNDTHGHLAGDAGLRQVAQRIVSSVRGRDIVARFGGEEFAILLTDVDAGMVGQIADRIRSAVDGSPMTLRGEAEASLTVSIGFAVYPTDGRDAETLLQRADAALYEAKARGRNRSIAAADVPTARSSAADHGPTLPEPKPYPG